MQYLKAIFGAVVAGLGAAQIALADGHITSTEWVQIAIATVTAAGVIWGVPNIKTD
jgi:hypothetical protein